MIKVFKATDNNFTTNGEIILKPIDAVIVKNIEEEYIELECPLKYADFLIQDNILIVDTLTGKKGYKIHNPIIGNVIEVKAWLCYQETITQPADRGAVISQGKNLRDCKVIENWDDVVTRLIPIGYKDITLPEGSISIVSPYQRVYERTIVFDLSEHLEEQVDLLEEIIDINTSLEASLKNSIITLQAKFNSYDGAIASLQSEKTTLIQRRSQLGNSEPELKEKAIIDAQIPLVDEEIIRMNTDKNNTKAVLDGMKQDLIKAQSDLAIAKNEYNTTVLSDLRSQAQHHLDVNKFPQINYDLEAHLNGVIEIGDIIKVKHPDMRVDLLTSVTAYKFDCLTMRFRQVEFGTQKISLLGKFKEVEKKIEKVADDGKKLGNSITKYYSDFKRDNEELVSKFTSELYGLNNGVYGLIQKNSSIFRQTASEISGTVSRVSADLGTQIASLRITADEIRAEVSHNFTSLDGKITNNTSLISQTATEIRSEVSSTVTNLSGQISSNTSLISQTATQIRSEVSSKFNNYSTTTEMNSAITQSASSITSTVSATYATKTNLSTVEQTADKVNWLVKSGTSSTNFTLTDRAISLVASTIDLTGFVKFTNLSTSGQTTINGGNITTGTIDASKANITNINAANISVGNLSASRISGGTLNFSYITVSNLSASSITTGILDASKITVTNLSADSIKSGALSVNYIQSNGYLIMNQGSYSNSIRIGGSNYQYVQLVEIGATTFHAMSSYCKFGSSTSSIIGFFGATGSNKKTVSTVSTSADLSTVAGKVNELINALKAYNFV